MNNGPSLQLSVVIVTPDGYPTIRKTIRHLRAQTVLDALELVIVAPSRADIEEYEPELRCFPRVRIVEIGALRTTGSARAAGIRAATAPLVVLSEDHCYPEPGWAGALIQAHRQPWAAVGPAFGNANPESLISWAGAFVNLSRWLAPVTSRVVDDLPGRNCSYKRALLLEFGDQLEAMLDAESEMHASLRARGYALYLESAARTNHRNISEIKAFIDEQFLVGRLFGGARARSWSPAQRVLRIGAAPLVPWVRLRRIVPDIRRAGRERALLPHVLPALVLGLVAHALGETAGFARGIGDADVRISRLEFHREGSM
jgi:hypothetical protein